MSALCARCEAHLRRLPCGCWVDLTRWSRWCKGGTELHQPNGGTQPESCPDTEERP